MPVKLLRLLFLITLIVPFIVFSQNIERLSFDAKDSTDGYYLAVRPQSNDIKAVVVMLTSFLPPGALLPETRLHNITYVNDMLFVVASSKQKLYADSPTVNRLDLILKDVVTRFKADTAKFVLAGYDEAGNIALRYTELTYEHPAQFPVHPKAVFGIDSHVGLSGLWHWAEEQIKKNYYPGAVGDAKYYLDAMTKENGTIYNNPAAYNKLSPFNKALDTTGNEQFLKSVAVRLYYDNDINWQLKNRRNSYYDTKMPDASELIKRLLLSGKEDAELIVSRQPGVRNNGMRHPNALSIVDEVDCIQWIKRTLDIFDPNTWNAPYKLGVPKGWEIERFSLPPDFAPGLSFKGSEDVRFAPGWGDSASVDYWSYAYLWWIGKDSKTDALILQDNLNKYYTGLVGRNITDRKIPADKLVPVTVAIKKLSTAEGDKETYDGTIHMLDYMTQRPIVLNALIHIVNCAAQKHEAVLVEISPKPFGHPLWQEFTRLAKEFQCSN